jgi:hypothetical protein
MFNMKGERKIPAGALLYLRETWQMHFLNPVPKDDEKDKLNQEHFQERKQQQLEEAEQKARKKQKRNRFEGSDEDESSVESGKDNDDVYIRNRADKKPKSQKQIEKELAAELARKRKLKATDVAHAALTVACNQYRPWIISKNYQDILDRCVDTMLIPTGYKRHCQVRRLFKQTGHLNGAAKIQIITTYMEFILWTIRQIETFKRIPDSECYPAAYLLFHAVLSDDFVEIQSPSFSKNITPDGQKDADGNDIPMGELPMLFFKVLETNILHNGLFPISEQKIIWHQIVDIVAFLKNFGPARGDGTSIVTDKKEITQRRYLHPCHYNASPNSARKSSHDNCLWV